MKNLKYFKILFRYLKEDKLQLGIYIFLNIILASEGLIVSVIWAFTLEALTKLDYNAFIIGLSIWTGLEIISYTFLNHWVIMIYNRLEKSFVKNVNKDLYKKISDLPAIAFEDYSVGEFVNRIYTDPENVLSLLDSLIFLFIRLINAILITIVAFVVSPMVGFELLILIIIMYLLSHFYFPKIKDLQKNIKDKTDNYVRIATQNLMGIREIKGLGIKNNINKKVDNIIDDLFVSQYSISKSENIYFTLNNFSYFVIQFAILLTMGLKVLNGSISIGAFVLIEGYIWKIDEVVKRLSDFGIKYNKIIVSLKRIDEVLYNRLYEPVYYGNKKLNDETYNIEFKDVYFKYRDTDPKYILKGLNLSIEPNKKIAIVGKSGQGKSTVFNLLLRYFDSSKGEITINGVNIRELTEDTLRNTISVIRQEPYLFNQTILENFKDINNKLTLKEIREACKRAYIDDYIMSLPDKYNTVIGEGGVNLSGGQKQRIAIARTLLKNTKIILFDEATSALDNESQEFIKKTIDDLAHDHTIIIVAHRLSTIMDSDNIIIIDDGKLLDNGTHDELMKKSDYYRKLYIPETL